LITRSDPALTFPGFCVSADAARDFMSELDPLGSFMKRPAALAARLEVGSVFGIVLSPH
jgi:hypothetical protein